MIFSNKKGLTFDDVTLVPDHSTVMSRSAPSTLTKVGIFSLKIPIIAAPMNTVCEFNMSRALEKLGASSVIHRYMSIEDQVNQAKCHAQLFIDSKFEYPFFAIGANGDFFERAKALHEIGINKFCIDVANGDSVYSISAIKKIAQSIPDAIIMAGNVCTGEGFARLADAGADLIRVGVGSGAMCKTRIVTGHGVPQLTALILAEEARRRFPRVGIISDGGIRSSGDIVKALAIADFVMLGSLLAGTDEAPGDIIKENGEQYKLYAGMASEDGRALGNWFDERKTSFVPEGESTKLKYKGSVTKIIEDLVAGLKVGMSYAGALDLNQLKLHAQFMEVTSAGAIEGTPHGKY